MHADLTRHAECTLWSNGVFQISVTTFYNLINALRNPDFGVFVLSPDDLTILRGQQNRMVRDNVIFELGLFIGRLSVDHCFFISLTMSLTYGYPSTSWALCLANTKQTAQTATDQHLGLERHGKAYALAKNTHKHNRQLNKPGTAGTKV